jgi:hypothetical protein
VIQNSPKEKVIEEQRNLKQVEIQQVGKALQRQESMRYLSEMTEYT